MASDSERWHGGKRVARPFATVKSMSSEAKSVPVARWHENPGETEKFAPASPPESVPNGPRSDPSSASDKLKVVHSDPSDDGSIPPRLRRCEQCGEPSDADKGAVMQRDVGRVQHWLHADCDFEF